MTNNVNDSRQLADAGKKYNPMAFFVDSIKFNEWIYDYNNSQNVDHVTICNFGYKTFDHVECKTNYDFYNG